MAAISLTIGELVGYVTLDDDQWRRGIRDSRKDLETLHQDVSRFGDRAIGTFLQVAGSLAKIPATAAAVQGTLSVLSSMSGALGLIPAAGAGALVTIAALKLGVQGFGDAMTAADPAAFAEALETLSPSARASAIAVRDLADEWEAMQNQVQEQLFRDLADDITKLGGTYIPVLQQGLAGIAAGFNAGAQQTAAFLGEARQVQTVQDILGGTRDVAGELGGAMRPLVSILLDLVAVGMEFLPGLAGGFADSAKQAAVFIRHARETGQLKAWMTEGLSTVGDLVKLFKQLGQIVSLVFGGLSADGAGLLDTLLSATARVRDFLASFEGQQALQALGAALRAVSAVVTGVMITAFEQLAPIIVAAAPGFAELAGLVGGLLVAALRVAGPLLVGLAAFLSDNVDWLGPLALALYGAAKALDVVSVAVKALTLVASLNPWVIIIAATIALVTFIIAHWDQIKAIVAAAWDWIKRTAAVVWEAIRAAIVNPIVSAATWIKDRFTDVVNFFRQVPGWIGGALGALFDVITAPFRRAWEYITGLIRRIVDAIREAIGMIGSLASAVSSIGTTSIAGTPVMPGRAHGGPVRAGTPYWVGEHGRRELYVPDQDGVIIPEQRLGADGAGGHRFHIEHFHADGQSPRDISEELLWHTKAGG